MSLNVNAIAVQTQARMNAVDVNTPELELSLLNYLATALKASGVDVDRAAFDLVLENLVDDVGGATSLSDMAKMMASIEKDFVDVRRRTFSFRTAGIFNVAVPDGVYIMWATGCSAGGGGAGSVGSTSNPGNPAGSGAAAGMSVVRYPIFVTPGEVIQVIVGQRGIGGIVGNNGLHGGATAITSIKSKLYMGGGVGGTIDGLIRSPWAYFQRHEHVVFIRGGYGGGENQSGEPSETHSGGVCATGNINYARRFGGGGGSSFFGRGGDGGDQADKDGQDAHGPGAGGGGAFRDSQGHGGGDGQDGFIELEY